MSPEFSGVYRAMSVIYLKEVEALKNRVLSMSALVEESVLRSVFAFKENDVELARDIIKRDDRIDILEVEIEEECLKIMALHQPVASDLRFITSFMRINTNLERIGDLAVNIAQQVVKIHASDLFVPEINFDDIAERAKAMLKQALDAFLNLDTELAAHVRGLDNAVDKRNRKIQKKLIACIKANPEKTEDYLRVLRVSRKLERVADLAVDICELVIYITRGEIVRHRPENETFDEPEDEKE